MRNTKSQGYTLVEVVVVLAILSGLALVALTGQVKKYQLDAFTEQVADSIHLTQQLATCRNQPFELRCQDVDGQPAMVVASPMDAHAPEYVLLIPDDLEVCFSTSEHMIRFTEDMSPDKGGTITITHEALEEIRRLTVQIATGKVTLYDDEG